MNLGLNSKRNLALISNSFATNDVAYMNIDKKDANLFINILTISKNEGIENKIGDIVLTYSYLNSDHSTIYGKGIRLGIIKEINNIVKNESNIIESLTVTNSDFTNVTYQKEENSYLLKNPDVDSFIEVEYKSEENIISILKIRLYDNYGNYYQYDYDVEEPTLYPTLLHRVEFYDNDNIEFNYRYGKCNSIKYKDQEITFTQLPNSFLGNINFKVNGEVYSYCDLSHTNSSYTEVYLTEIKKFVKYTNENGESVQGLLEHKKYTFNNCDYVEVKNNITGHFVKYNFTNDRVSSFVNCGEALESSGQTTSINYGFGYTEIINYKGHITKYYIKDNRIICTIDHRGNITSMKYDEQGRLIEHICDFDIRKEASEKRENMLPSGYTFEEGSFTVSELLENSYVNILDYRNKVLNIYNDSESHDMEINFNIENIKVKKNEGLTFLATVNKLEQKINYPLKFIIRLYNKDDNNENNVQYISVEAVELFSQEITISKLMIANNDYDCADITIKVPQNYTKYMISNIQFYKEFYGTMYEYNEYGLIEKIWSRDNVTKRSFLKEDNRLLLTKSNNDFNGCVINYNSYGKPIEILNSDGSVIEYNYDDFGNCIYESFKNKDGKYFDNHYTYTTDGLKMLSETNNDDETINYDYDQNNRVIKKIIYPDGRIDKFNYNDKLFVNSALCTIEDNIETIQEYTYDTCDRIETIKLNNDYSYLFEYDTNGNILCTKLIKNQEITELERDTYIYDNHVYTGNLGTRRIGNSDVSNNKRRYTYDEEDKLTKVYAMHLDDETLICEFEYSDTGNPIKLKDYIKNKITYFTYDKYNNVIKEETVSEELNSRTNYRYDLKGNLLLKNDIVDNRNLGYYCYNDKNNKFNSPVKIYNYFKDKENLYSCFLLSKDKNGNLKADLSNNKEKIQHLDETKIPEVEVFDNGIAKAFDLRISSHKDLSYKYSLNKDNNSGNTFAFWFKTGTYNESKTLLSICDLDLDNNGEVISKTTKYDIVFTNSGKLRISGNGDITQNGILLDQWNFISISILQLENGGKCEINLNGICSTLLTDKQLETSFQEFCFGDFIKNKESTFGFTGKMTCLFMSSSLLGNKEIEEIYSLTKENYIDYISLENESFDKYYVTNSYEHSNSLKIAPLTNSFEMLDNSLMYDYNLNDTFNHHLDNLFVYNESFKNYVYNANYHKLIYNIPYSAVMKTYINASIKDLKGNQMILEYANSTNGLIGLFIDNTGLLKGYINDTVVNTNILIEPNCVNKYCLSYYLSNYNNQTKIFTYRMSIVLNDEEVLNDFYDVDTELLVEKIVVGASLGESIYSRFNGYMNNLIINDTGVDIEGVSNLCVGDTVIETVNNMGQLYKHQILRNNQNIITHDVHYKESVDQDQNKCYNKIVKDEFFTSSLDNPIREINYQTDSINGNVTRKTLSSLNVNYEDIKYQYDKFGQLISEENITDNVKTIYSYDKNGNINSKNEYVLSTNELKNSTNYLYNLNNTNKLEKFIKNDVNLLINYDDNMTSMPVSFVEEETGETKCALEWDFRNLTKVSLGSNYIINYDYDARGLRTSKEVLDDIAMGTITHNYRYSGNLLIEESVDDTIMGETYKLNYLYDQSGKLYGLKYDGELYYYLRDSLQTIIGIVNESRNLICEYKYDAYGNHIVLNSNRTVNTSDRFIGNINPFRYKGYYYDVETNLFLVSSRYYSPELCRWISPDDIEYLDPESVNGLNLYCYCLNNPIMYVDPDGHMPKWAQWVVGGLAVAGLIVATVLTCGAAGAGAAAVGTAMLVGGVVSGGIEIIDQLHDTGTVDWTSVAISTLSGTAYGLVIGLTGGTGAWAVAGKFAVAGGTSLLNSWNEWDENSTFGGMMASFALSLAVSGVAQGAGYLTGKFGPKVLSKLMPKNPNHLITMGDIGSYLWGIPAVKTGVIRFAGGVAGSIFNDYF